MSDTKKIIYFRPIRREGGKDKPYGDSSGDSFENAKFISSLITEGWDGNGDDGDAGIWKNCDIRIAHYVRDDTGVRVSYNLTIPGVIQFENTSVTGGYIDNDTLTPLVTSNIASYAVRLQSNKYDTIAETYVNVNRRFNFLGNCVLKYIQLSNISNQDGGSGIIISGDNNQFILSRIDTCITGKYGDRIFVNSGSVSADGTYNNIENKDNMFSIDMSEATNTVILSCYFEGNVNTRKINQADHYFNIPPYQYCIGNEYNRGINDGNIVAGEDDPLKISTRWRATTGDICRFEMFGCSPYNKANDGTYIILDYQCGGDFTGIKYRKNEDSTFPILKCTYTQIIPPSVTRYFYFRRHFWGEIENERNDNTPSCTVEAEQQNKKFEIKTKQLTLSISNVLNENNGIINDCSGLTYNNALPLHTIYEFNKETYDNDTKRPSNVFIGLSSYTNSKGKTITTHYTYNHSGDWNWWNKVSKYITNDETGEPNIIHDGMYDYIKKHPNQFVGGCICCVDGFAALDNLYPYDGIPPHMLNKRNVFEFDLAPKQIKIQGGMVGWNSTSNSPIFKYQPRTSKNQTLTDYSYFYNSVNCVPYDGFTTNNTSVIMYGLYQHYYRLMYFHGCNIKIYDRYINPNIPFKIGNKECNDSSFHMYSAALLSQKNISVDNGVGSTCTNIFVVDENIRQRITWTHTKYNDKSDFWPSIISTSTYNSYYIAPRYGEFNNSTAGTVGGNTSRYYYNQCRGAYIYNPINIGWLVVLNNVSCSDVGYGYVSSLTLQNTLVAPPSEQQTLNVGIECDSPMGYNCITNSLLINGEPISSSKTLTTFVTGLDISKYNMIAFQNGTYMTYIELGIIPNNKFIDNNVRTASNTFYSTTFTHDVGKNTRLIIHPFWNTIQYEYYDENTEQFLPCQQLTPWVGGNIKSTCITAISANTLSSLPYAMYISTRYISSIPTPFESNMVSSLSCYTTSKLK